MRCRIAQQGIGKITKPDTARKQRARHHIGQAEPRVIAGQIRLDRPAHKPHRERRQIKPHRRHIFSADPMRRHQPPHAINRGMRQPARGKGFVCQPRHLPCAAKCGQAWRQIMFRFRQLQKAKGPGQPLRRPCRARCRQIRRAQPRHGSEAHLHRQRHGPFRMRLHGPR